MALSIGFNPDPQRIGFTICMITEFGKSASEGIVDASCVHVGLLNWNSYMVFCQSAPIFNLKPGQLSFSIYSFEYTQGTNKLKWQMQRDYRISSGIFQMG